MTTLLSIPNSWRMNWSLGHESHFRSFTYWSDQHSLTHTNWQLASYRLNTCITIMTDLHHTKTLPSSQIVSTNWVDVYAKALKSHSQLFFKHWGWRSCESCKCYFNKKFRFIPIWHCPPKIKTLLILLGKFFVELSWTKFKSSLDYFSSQNGDELLKDIRTAHTHSITFLHIGIELISPWLVSIEMVPH